MLSLGPYIWADVEPTNPKQEFMQLEQLQQRGVGSSPALINALMFEVRLLPTLFTFPGESFPVAASVSLALGVRALRLCYSAPPCGGNAVPFATTPEVLKLSWE